MKDTDETQEAEANYFAMCLLIPARFIREDLIEMGGIDYVEDDAIAKLAKKYQVSVSLMVLRCQDMMQNEPSIQEEIARRRQSKKFRQKEEKR